MITEWFLTLAGNFVAWLISVFPPWESPVWFTDLGGTISGVTDMLTGLGAWVPWDVLNYCLAAVLLAWVAFASIKLARAAVAHIPQFGGNG